MLKCPAKCLHKIVEGAIRMRAVENEVQVGLRRNGLVPAEKRKWIGDAPERNGL